MEKTQLPSQGEVHRGVPILPLRDTVIFPQSILPLAVGRESTVKLLNENADRAEFIGVVTQKDASVEAPGAEDLHGVGSSVRIHKSVRMPDGSVRLVVQGGFRFRILRVVQVNPYLRADIEVLPSLLPTEDEIEVDALTRGVHSVFSKVVEMSPQLADEVGSLAATLNDPGRLADFVALFHDTPATESRQKILETQKVRDRLKTVHEALLREQEVLEVGSKIESQVKNEVGRTQREYYLREQMKAIQKELGENDESTKEIEDLRAKIQEAKMPEDAEKEALRELNRLSKSTPSAGPISTGSPAFPGPRRPRTCTTFPGRRRSSKRITTTSRRSRIASSSSSRCER